ncbi:hypothetical protein, partial [Pseudopedobacter sp.]|uniref:hypothetical protein n=1 Tax=Pseudopedobacter sp. TaxID=1936787 RepID=UPI00334296C8
MNSLRSDSILFRALTYAGFLNANRYEAGGRSWEWFCGLICIALTFLLPLFISSSPWGRRCPTGG